MPPAPRFRLVRLEAAHWRGIGDAVSIPLDQPLNIIYGPNGAGKSSLLTAIEWALFSREAQRITDHHIAERRGWETRYVHSREQPSVEFELVSGGRKSSVLRAGRTPSMTPAVQASYADFKGLVFLHQETLRDFLVGTPASRQSAFQRLLDVDTVDRAVDAMERQLHTRLLEARRQLGALEFDAAAVGLAPPWEDTLKRLTGEVEALKQSTAPPPSTSAAERRQKIESRRAAWLAAQHRGPLGAAVVLIGEPQMIEPQQPQDGRVNIVHMDGPLDGAQTDLVCSADRLSALDAAAGKDHGEAPGIVVAPVALLVERRAPELAAPDHQCVVQHAAALEIFEQRGHGLV